MHISLILIKKQSVKDLKVLRKKKALRIMLKRNNTSIFYICKCESSFYLKCKVELEQKKYFQPHNER